MSSKNYTGIKEEGLTLYRATIPLRSLNDFDRVLDNLSQTSGVLPGHRLKYIMPEPSHTIYEVLLSDEELMVMTLSLPGVYHMIRDKEDQQFMRSYLAETSR